jgi:CRISPR/Cas system CSM-associated protein Csm3 (group 7 of RAMP superfamily)
LTTLTPLHIGTGRFEKRAELRHGREEDEPQTVPEAKAVLLDTHDRPCLTPTGMKGAMLSWCVTHLGRTQIDDALFGCGPTPGNEAVGGRLEFHTARLDEASTTMQAASATPFHKKARHTDLDTGVRINRASGTALDRHLFYKETVTPGAVFKVLLDLDVPPDSLDDGTALIERTLALLDAFNPGGPVPPLALGAMTGRGHGRFEWTPERLLSATDETVRAWISDGAPGTWENALKPVPGDISASCIKAGQAMRRAAQARAELVCEVTLAFDHRFFVSEPGRVVTQAQADARKTEKTAGIMPKVDKDGRAVLPTASIKGVLRSRAERILATLTGDEEPFGHAPGRGRAGMDDPAAYMGAEGLATERLFGAASWRAALAVDPFEPVGPRAPATTQELVAIDRFTGGASGSAKYAIDAFDRPTFKGRLRLSLDRSQPEDVGLLVLLLRDLAEGDVTFGYGSTKGYGSAQASVTVQVRGAYLDPKALSVSAAAGPGFDTALAWADVRGSALEDPLREAVTELRRLYRKGEAA